MFTSYFNQSYVTNPNLNPNIKTCANRPHQKYKTSQTKFSISLQESPKANCYYLFLRIWKGFFSYSVKNNMMLTFQNKLLTVFHYVSLRYKAQKCYPA